MSYCLGCLACQTACPAGVNYAELFETARSDIEIQGAHPGVARKFWRAVTLGVPVRAPARASGRGPAAARLSTDRRRGSACGDPACSGCCRRRCAASSRQTPRMAPAFSNALIAAREEPDGPARYRVALLTGCIQDLVFSDVNRDTADVLLANGCAVDTPPLQPCCGSLHAHNGDTGRAQQLARRMIDLMPPDRYDAIVTNAGGCGSHLRRYGPLLEDDPRYRDRANAWDAKVRDIHEWLASIDCRAPAAGPFAEPATRHVPRVVSSRARTEDLAAAAGAAPAAARRDARGAARVELVLWKRRHLRDHAARAGRRAAAPQDGPRAVHGRRLGRDRQPRLPSPDRARARRRRRERRSRPPDLASRARVSE